MPHKPYKVFFTPGQVMVKAAMDENQFDDLKQFITATISQTEKRLEAKIVDVKGGLGGLHSAVDDLRSEIAGLRNEMADGFSGIGEAIEKIFFIYWIPAFAGMTGSE